MLLELLQPIGLRLYTWRDLPPNTSPVVFFGIQKNKNDFWKPEKRK
jgi:hypothetical protein